MNKDDELEAIFRGEISKFLLHFKNTETEAKYIHYKLYERKVPRWFKILIWSFVTMLILRRIQLLVYVLFGIQATATEVSVEVITVVVLLSGLLIEGIAIMCKPLSFLKGFAIMVASFFTIAHSSHEYYPNKPAMITMYFLASYSIEAFQFLFPVPSYATGTSTRG